MNSNSGEVDPEHVISLAENFLNSRSSSPDRARRNALKKNLEEWKEKKEETEEDDPLYDHVNNKYEEQQEKWNEMFGDMDENKKEFLELVSERYVAEGFWLNDTIIRALNLMLFGKLNDNLVIEREKINQGSEFEDEQLYKVSKKIRTLAQNELDLIKNVES
ncbi:MAG: hypothetical protein ABEK59_09960 [Halobacteria archaeon]